MHRTARLSALAAAALLVPGVAAAADTVDDPLAAMLGDQELVLPPAMSVAEAARIAFASATAPMRLADAELDLSAPPAAHPFAAPSEAPAPRQYAALSDDELGGQRGGFMTPLGLEVGFGAIIRTTIDGALALETTMTWTDAGTQTVHTFGSPTDPGAAASAAAAGGINLGPASGWSGIVQPGDGGATAVLHDLSQNAISSLIVNTANNRNVRQETEITLSIPDFAAAQAQMIGEQMRLRLNDAVGSALTAALPH